MGGWYYQGRRKGVIIYTGRFLGWALEHEGGSVGSPSNDGAREHDQRKAQSEHGKW